MNELYIHTCTTKYYKGGQGLYRLAVWSAVDQKTALYKPGGSTEGKMCMHSSIDLHCTIYITAAVQSVAHQTTSLYSPKCVCLLVLCLADVCSL